MVDIPHTHLGRNPKYMCPSCLNGKATINPQTKQRQWRLTHKDTGKTSPMASFPQTCSYSQGL